MQRATVARIHRQAISQNYQLACRLAPESANLAVIKANAYGHGLGEIARWLEPDVPAFAVAIVDEALQLRQEGITKPVVILEGVSSAGGFTLAAEQNFWPVIHSEHQLSLLKQADRHPVCWLKVDTGMHRLGLTPDILGEAVETVKALSRTAPVICTHFACADNLQHPMTANQTLEFKALTAGLNCPVSLANSPALLAHPDAHGDWNRPGLMLYGCSPFAETQEQALKLAPAMTLESEIIALREVPTGDTVGYGARWQAPKPTRVATLAIGYADGYPRNSHNGCRVWLHDAFAPVIGKVSMDMVTIDVTHIPQAAVGDKVELWGQHVPVSEVADLNQTINYELLTRVSARVPRIYED